MLSGAWVGPRFYFLNYQKKTNPKTPTPKWRKLLPAVRSERFGGGDAFGLGPAELGVEGEPRCERRGEPSKEQVEEHQAKGGKWRRNWL